MQSHTKVYHIPLILLLFVTLQSASATPIWWEAEDFVEGNFPPPDENPFAPDDAQQAALLSGSAWIGMEGDFDEIPYLEYEVDIPSTGPWQFYVRKFWRHGPFRWRWDDQPWQTLPSDHGLLDRVTLRLHVEANWVALGTVDLEPGIRRLRIELIEDQGAAAFDAFLLTTSPFTARGAIRPDERFDRAPVGWFPFEPDRDTFQASPIDWRHLNEPYAGHQGWIQAQDDHFIHEATGERVRFWAVNVGPGILRLDRPSIDYLARDLAKSGVNMVRYHGRVWQRGSPRTIDPALQDGLHYLIAALKREGIYTALSIYFPLFLTLEASDGIEGYAGEHPFGIVYFHPEFQSLYRYWWQETLLADNPYTGITLANDPAVAMLELVNEDSLFFYTFTPYERIPGPAMNILEEQFADWAAQQHGSLSNAFVRWRANQGYPVRGDDLNANRAGLLSAYDTGRPEHPRAADAARFLAETQRAFFDSTRQFLRDELGTRALITGSNWRTANAQTLGPLDKYSNTGLDFMDRHAYYHGLHEGPRSSFALDKGDRFAHRAAVRFDPQLPDPGIRDMGTPFMDVVYNRLPSTLSEFNWPMPNRYRTEATVLMSAYASLQGTDGLFWFALDGADWLLTHSKFPIQTPAIYGQFPATAFIYRQGLLQEAPFAVDAHVTAAELYELQGAPVADAVQLDNLRLADVPEGASLDAGHTEISKDRNVLAPRVTDPEGRTKDIPVLGKTPQAERTKDIPVLGNVSQADRTRDIPVPGSEEPSPIEEWIVLNTIDGFDIRSFYAGRVGLTIGESPTPSVIRNLDSYIRSEEQQIQSLTGELLYDYGQGRVTIHAPSVAGVTGFFGTNAVVELGPVSFETHMDYGSLLVVALDGQPLTVSTQILVQVMSEEKSYGWSTSPTDDGRHRIESLGEPPIVVREFQGRIRINRPDAADLQVNALDSHGYPIQVIGSAHDFELHPITFYYLIQ